MRMTHEAAFWEEEWEEYSIFLTLTYNDEHLPYGATLVKEDIQNFFKRLWWKIDGKLRYYVVGEYGTQCENHDLVDCPMCGPLQRPHYHAIIFGWTPPDAEVLGQRDGMAIARSDIIEAAWTKRNKEGEKTVIGYHEFGSCTFESCNYVARYTMKKITGDEDRKANHYIRKMPDMNDVQLEPEFAMMSKNPGIGKPWFDKYRNDIYHQDECPIPGRSAIGKPGLYYDHLYEKINPRKLEEIKEARREAMLKSLNEGPSIKSRALVQDARILNARKL